MTVVLPGAVPELPVADLATATAYYRDAFGFTIDWVGADIDLAGISRDRCRIFLAGPAFRAERGTVGPHLVWLNLDGVEQVDALHRAWREAGALLQSVPETKPWGLHEFTAMDPDGNRWRVFHDVATPERERSSS